MVVLLADGAEPWIVEVRRLASISCNAAMPQGAKHEHRLLHNLCKASTILLGILEAPFVPACEVRVECVGLEGEAAGTVEVIDRRLLVSRPRLFTLPQRRRAWPNEHGSVEVLQQLEQVSPLRQVVSPQAVEDLASLATLFGLVTKVVGRPKDHRITTATLASAHAEVSPSRSICRVVEQVEIRFDIRCDVRHRACTMHDEGTNVEFVAEESMQLGFE